MGFQLIQILTLPPSNTPLNPKIGDLKTTPLHYGQAVANGATLELIEVVKLFIAAANAPI